MPNMNFLLYLPAWPLIHMHMVKIPTYSFALLAMHILCGNLLEDIASFLSIWSAESGKSNYEQTFLTP